ncbi:hypothetical protein PISMIDRAFT_677258 [Pisolithus microcarpus 441]|uniref:Uncharacterized protein n=1 Tax=Pisolithus microcarpus 441 TaxID=765257 RepID=A0A0C9ZHG1_9AGAM|nr:hypothetical protein BKA83DRAFT_677258 [Pisolithus microcarpus]KIK25419.1 hypothetical protein PISMIDRAFT_677258 [Pisolithus microcarpus 441]
MSLLQSAISLPSLLLDDLLGRAPRNERVDSGTRMNTGNNLSPTMNPVRGSGASYDDDGRHGSSKRSSHPASSDRFSESGHRTIYKEPERKERESHRLLRQQAIAQEEWKEREALNSEVYRLNSELRSMREQLNVCWQELLQAKTENDETKRRLEEKANELKGAQAFLKHANKLSGAEVISLVNDLNSEVFQGAASMVDTLEFERASRRMDDAAWKRATGATSKTIGEELTQALIAKRGKDKDDYDPILVRYALQTCLIVCCSKICKSWAPEEENSQFLRSVYSEIQKKEDQVVAGRWRALTRAHIRETRNPEAETKQIIRELCAVLIVAGCSDKELSTELEKDLSEITALAMGVRTAIGESITSMDLEPYIPRLGETFDAALMEEEDGSQAQGKNTVGFTGLGLTQLVNGGRMLALVKAKVLLD